MQDSIGFNPYINYSPDDEIWNPIQSAEDIIRFDSLILAVENYRESGTKKQKGDSLEELMDFIYNRFIFVDKVIHNRSNNDNQIDHTIHFLENSMPHFIYNNSKSGVIIGESKNHKKSIGTREVSNLNQLLRTQRTSIGIFSSYKSFSKGKNVWCASEGVRRKLLLTDQNIIIGFNINELKMLKQFNFYTMIKQKYQNLVDEVEDEYSDNDKLPYNEYLLNTLDSFKKIGIITDESYLEIKGNIETRYGNINS